MVALFSMPPTERKRKEGILLCEMRKKKETMMMMTDCFPL
jgi:hypothetical protein